MRLLTLRQVEEITGLCRSTLYRRIKTEKLQALKLDNGDWRVPEEEIAKILAGPAKVSGDINCIAQ